ncbi:SixA phosphatase family protein [Sagittula salina]|uniref:Histidine phosphatase family protein n=1 Tax=Sagittula salina TaxID=2820268 RepID=A0A940MPE8_9RHOB|nr:histidine phosphatase family protein [Sagittula salina]MBP0482311.1 histidine phosphatase family protein [Sagittula salina]
MKRLILMRHAKSDWNAGHPDSERPLNGRGRRSAKAMGLWLKDMEYLPQEILCSSAVRTRETLDGLNVSGRTSYLKALYLADEATLLKHLRKATEDCVLMLGHNPGIGDFAHALVTGAPDHARWDDYPTCSTMVADFDIPDWESLLPGTGHVVDFVVGRDLTD